MCFEKKMNYLFKKMIILFEAPQMSLTVTHPMLVLLPNYTLILIKVICNGQLARYF